MTGFQFHLLVAEVVCFTTTEPGRTALGKKKYACFALLIFFCWSTSSAHCRLTSFLLGRRCINILCDEKCNFRVSSTIKHTEGKRKKSSHQCKLNHDQRASLMDLGPVKSCVYVSTANGICIWWSWFSVKTVSLWLSWWAASAQKKDTRTEKRCRIILNTTDVYFKNKTMKNGLWTVWQLAEPTLHAYLHTIKGDTVVKKM